MWLRAKFQRETESLASSYLQRKIKLQKPLVEILHTFSSIGMADRNSRYIIPFTQYRFKGRASSQPLAGMVKLCLDLTY